MHLISVDVSPKQLSKLRNGHKVRVKKGSGVSLVVHPATYNIVSRAFRKSKGAEIQLSPDELQANMDMTPEAHAEYMEQADGDLFGEMSGQGLYAGGRVRVPKALKKLGRTLKKGFQDANKFLKGNPVTKAIVGKVAPKVLGALGAAGATYLTGNPMVGKLTNDLLSKGAEAGLKSQGYGLYAGRGLEDIKRASISNAHANDAIDKFSTSQIIARHGAHPLRSYYPVDEFPNAPPSRGTGIRAHKLYDVNAIRGRGASIAQDGGSIPALTPQPYGENFHMQFFLPPQYQKFNRGTTEPI